MTKERLWQHSLSGDWIKSSYCNTGFPLWLRRSSVCLQRGRPGFDPWVRKILWRRRWQPTPVFLPGKSHGRRSPVGYSPWGCRVRHDWVTSLHCNIKASLMAQMGKESACNAWDLGSIPGWREWLSTPVFLPGESHGQRSLVGYSPWGHTESEWLTQTDCNINRMKRHLWCC